MEINEIIEKIRQTESPLKRQLLIPASALTEEESPVEIAELGEGLQCRIIGIEDLLIDRLNACKYRKSEIDCEMVELLLKKYNKGIRLGLPRKQGIKA